MHVERFTNKILSLCMTAFVLILIIKCSAVYIPYLLIGIFAITPIYGCYRLHENRNKLVRGWKWLVSVFCRLYNLNKESVYCFFLFLSIIYFTRNELFYIFLRTIVILPIIFFSMYFLWLVIRIFIKIAFKLEYPDYIKSFKASI